MVVRPMSNREALQIAIIENVQRQDLTALEEAEGYQRLIAEFSLTQEDVAQAVGKSRSHIANTLRLLDLPRGRPRTSAGRPEQSSALFLSSTWLSRILGPPAGMREGAPGKSGSRRVLATWLRLLPTGCGERLLGAAEPAIRRLVGLGLLQRDEVGALDDSR